MAVGWAGAVRESDAPVHRRTGCGSCQARRMTVATPVAERSLPGHGRSAGPVVRAPAARLLAAQVWDLAAAAIRCRAACAEAHDVLDRAEADPPAGAEAARSFAAATAPLYAVIADVPRLPAELLPPDWPGPELARCIGRAFAVFAPALHGYLATIRREEAPG